MSNWYIGQEIVAIEDHSQGKFKEGDIFIIKGLLSSKCKCSTVLIDIGLKKRYDEQRCIVCYNEWLNQTDTWWFSEKRFAPLDSFVNQEELNEIKQNLNLEPIWKN